MYSMKIINRNLKTLIFCCCMENKKIDFVMVHGNMGYHNILVLCV